MSTWLRTRSPVGPRTPPPALHRASVYRALATLGELGLVTHTHLGGAAAVYHLTGRPSRRDRRRGPARAPAVHVCSRVIDIPVATLQPLAETMDQELGFALEPRHTALLGVCVDCR